MKCSFCGANLTLKDETCPFCGHENEAAKEHIEAMRQYKQDYSEVREDVYETTSRFARKSTQLIIITVLVLLNIGAFLFTRAGYIIRNAVVESDIRSHQEEYSNTLDTYLENREYEKFNEFYDLKELYHNDYFDSYNYVHFLIADYNNVSRNLDYYINNDRQMEDSEYAKDRISYLSQSLYEFLDFYLHPADFYLEEAKAGHEAAADEIAEQLRVLMMSQFAITREEWDILPELSVSGITDCLERGAGYEK